MSKNFFHSKFAKSCKFKWDFIKNINEIERWESLSSNFDKAYSNIYNKNHNIISKKIHQIWIGPKKFPSKYIKWSKTWKKYNPTLEYKLWTENEISKLNMYNRKLYESTPNIGFRSDLARYEILYKYGGIYIDTDFECIKKIPEGLYNFNFVSSIGFDYEPIILNGLIMSSPQNPIIKELINTIKHPKNIEDPMNIINTSGPSKLTQIYFRNIKKTSSSKNLILPSNYCYPFPSFLINSSINKKSEIAREAFAIHHWEMSWMKGSFLKRFFRKVKLLIKNLKNIFQINK